MTSSFIPFCLEGLDLIFTRTMSRRLHPEWKAAFKKLTVAFDKFAPLYRKFVKACGKDPRSVLTPKLRVLLTYVRKWIRERDESIIGISEYSKSAREKSERKKSSF